jgi:hypothetical protein
MCGAITIRRDEDFIAVGNRDAQGNGAARRFSARKVKNDGGT